MIHDVKEFFGLEKEFRNTGFFETKNYKMIFQDIISAVEGPEPTFVTPGAITQ